MKARGGEAEADELRRLRAQKLQRYQRLQRIKESGLEWPQGPVDARTEAAIEFVKKYPVALLEFWAEWSRPSVKMRSVIDELAQEYWGDVAFARLDLDENPDAREVWGVTVLPTMIITKHALEVARLQGALTRTRLTKELGPFAASPEERLKRVGRATPPGEKGD
jgi:thioredoxin 1